MVYFPITNIRTPFFAKSGKRLDPPDNPSLALLCAPQRVRQDAPAPKIMPDG